MKVPLRYQLSEYDCGPTSILNGFSFLFDREEMPPEVIKNVTAFTLDRYGSHGERCMGGTSHMAMMYISNWINSYGDTGCLPVKSEYYSGKDVFLGEGSKISHAIADGAAVIVRLYYDVWHYVTLTGAKDNLIYLFDPYYTDEPFEEDGVELDFDHAFSYNRIVPQKYFDCEDVKLYAFGPTKKREAIVIRRTK